MEITAVIEDDSLVTGTSEDRIRFLHQRIHDAARRSVKDAIEIGRLLSERRAQLEHGKYMRWIASTLPFSDRTARRYVELYENRENLGEDVSTLTEAYRAVAEATVEAAQMELEIETSQISDDPREEVRGELDDEPPDTGPAEDAQEQDSADSGPAQKSPRSREDGPGEAKRLSEVGEDHPMGVQLVLGAIWRVVNAQATDLERLNVIIELRTELRKIEEPILARMTEEVIDAMPRTYDQDAIERELEAIENEEGTNDPSLEAIDVGTAGRSDHLPGKTDRDRSEQATEDQARTDPPAPKRDDAGAEADVDVPGEDGESAAEESTDDKEESLTAGDELRRAQVRLAARRLAEGDQRGTAAEIVAKKLASGQYVPPPDPVKAERDDRHGEKRGNVRIEQIKAP